MLCCIPFSRFLKRRGEPANGTEKQQAGTSANHGPGPAKEIDAQILERFQKVDKNQSGDISADELRTALKKEDEPPFEIDTVKLLMSIFDTDRSGTIDVDEFTGLWKYIEDWESVFNRFDTNHNRTIDGGELRPALKELGYELPEALQDLLQRKYDVNWNSGESAADGGPAAAPGGGPAAAAGGDPAAAPGGDPAAAAGGGPAAAPGGGPAAAAADGGPAAAPGGGRNSSSGITFDRFIRACVVVKQLKESFDALDRDTYGRVNVDYNTFLRLVFKLP